ncbi:hypothetical protein [Burkholderia arboris]|uniref:hypothetical protein n=1 Tax=Burkholderia arboris TaxID=488730 RepID=UPI00210D761D|nr:hypothetical protein [Burkholderia arboris]UTV55791.1 hypothetical protein NLX30_05250 [Burkholderia arboris]
MRQLRHAHTPGTLAHRNHSPESTLVLAIVSTALRAAALAPTYQDALDVTGDALRRLAELARAEVRHV